MSYLNLRSCDCYTGERRKIGETRGGGGWVVVVRVIGEEGIIDWMRLDLGDLTVQK